MNSTTKCPFKKWLDRDVYFWVTSQEINIEVVKTDVKKPCTLSSLYVIISGHVWVWTAVQYEYICVSEKPDDASIYCTMSMSSGMIVTCCLVYESSRVEAGWGQEWTGILFGPLHPITENHVVRGCAVFLTSHMRSSCHMLWLGWNHWPDACSISVIRHLQLQRHRSRLSFICL